MAKVLHLTAHMGGGVGRALSSLAVYANNVDRKNIHRILAIEKPEKTQFVDVCKENNVDIIFTDNIDIIKSEIMKSDIVQLSWWHHPKMVKILCNLPQIPTRMILWSHVSGCSYPALPFEFAEVFHKVFFTTEYTKDNPYWTSEQRRIISSKSEVIYGAGNINDIAVLYHKSHKGFHVGYVGTLNYSKLNPEFAYIASLIDIPDVKFIMVGDLQKKLQIINDAKKFNICNKLEFTGYIKDVSTALASFDVFGYPLNPWHFGSTENALIEAMAAEIPVVAFNQAAEKYIIKHMETGLLADTYEHYAQLIKYLFENPGERRRLGKNAREYALETYRMDKIIKRLNESYEQVLLMDIKTFKFSRVFGEKPYEWFLSCLGADREMFLKSISTDVYEKSNRERIEKDIINCHHILKEKSKSSIFHFAKVFSEDENLAYWKSIIQ